MATQRKSGIEGTPHGGSRFTEERRKHATEASVRVREAGGRKRIDPTTCEPDYAADEVEFMFAMQAYKETARRPFPTWREVLEVVKSLGYRRFERDDEDDDQVVKHEDDDRGGQPESKFTTRLRHIDGARRNRAYLKPKGE